MKALLPLILVLSLLALTGCDSNVSKGDKAWKTAQTLSGHQKLSKQKEAYFYYDKSVKKSIEAGKEIKPDVLNKYLEALITRMEFFLESQGHTSEPIQLFREDFDTHMKTETVRSDIKDRYASLIMAIGDGNKDAQKMTVAMMEYDKALAVAQSTKPAVQAKRDHAAEEYAAEQVATALNFQSSKETLDQIRAQFYAKVALKYNPSSAKAQQILTETRVQLVSSYTAYISAIENYTDKDLFKEINNQKVFISVPSVVKKGSGSLVLSISMFNDAPNALKLKRDYFTLTFENGKSSIATALKAKGKGKIVDQSREGEMSLVFAKRGKVITSLSYEGNSGIKTIKYFK